jgi:hypothetical protein
MIALTAIQDELSAEDEDNDIEASGDPFWVKYVVDTACSLKGRYIDISDVRTIVSELKCLGVELPSRDIDGNMESEGAQLDLNYDLLKEFHVRYFFSVSFRKTLIICAHL